MVVAFYRTTDRLLKFGGQPNPVVGAKDVRPVQARSAAVGKTRLPNISGHGKLCQTGIEARQLNFRSRA
jgi:hypothetical protein